MAEARGPTEQNRDSGEWGVMHAHGRRGRSTRSRGGGADSGGGGWRRRGGGPGPGPDSYVDLEPGSLQMNPSAPRLALLSHSRPSDGSVQAYHVLLPQRRGAVKVWQECARRARPTRSPERGRTGPTRRRPVRSVLPQRCRWVGGEAKRCWRWRLRRMVDASRRLVPPTPRGHEWAWPGFLFHTACLTGR